MTWVICWLWTKTLKASRSLSGVKQYSLTTCSSAFGAGAIWFPLLGLELRAEENWPVRWSRIACLRLTRVLLFWLYPDTGWCLLGYLGREFAVMEFRGAIHGGIRIKLYRAGTPCCLCDCVAVARFVEIKSLSPSRLHRVLNLSYDPFAKPPCVLFYGDTLCVACIKCLCMRVRKTVGAQGNHAEPRFINS